MISAMVIISKRISEVEHTIAAAAVRTALLPDRIRKPLGLKGGPLDRANIGGPAYLRRSRRLIR
jgi:hypothetical protein